MSWRRGETTRSSRRQPADWSRDGGRFRATSGFVRGRHGDAYRVRRGHGGRGTAGAAELSDATKAGWVTVVDANPNVQAFPDLDDGESSTLVVARDHTGPRLVVMDERLGRSHAGELGLSVVGVAGILIDARRQGLVGSVEPLLDRLERGGFRLAPDLVRIVLQRAGEGIQGSGG